LLPAGRIDPTGRQKRDVRACRLGGWMGSLASECFVLEHTLTLELNVAALDLATLRYLRPQRRRTPLSTRRGPVPQQQSNTPARSICLSRLRVSVSGQQAECPTE
jgi:hypothetical protein